MARKPAQPDQGKPDEAAVETDAAEAKQAEGEEQATEKAEAPEPKRPRRRRRKKADEEAPAAEAAAEEAEGAKEAADEEEVEAEAAEAEGEPEPEKEDATPAEEAKPERRRAASGVTAGRKRGAAVPAPRTADGAIAVSACAKYVRTAPRKARLVIEHIRGKPVSQARGLHPRLEVDLVQREGVRGLPLRGHPHPRAHREQARPRRPIRHHDPQGQERDRGEHQHRPPRDRDRQVRDGGGRAPARAPPHDQAVRES